MNKTEMEGLTLTQLKKQRKELEALIEERQKQPLKAPLDPELEKGIRYLLEVIEEFERIRFALADILPERLLSRFVPNCASCLDLKFYLKETSTINVLALHKLLKPLLSLSEQLRKEQEEEGEQEA